MPDALRRALYQQMLREELGRTLSGEVEPKAARNWVDLILPVTLMLMLAGLVLGGLYAYSMWQDGAFDRYASPLRPAMETPWQREDRHRPPEDLAPAKSEVDPVSAPVPPPEAEEPVTDLSEE
jgi:hypothetical protein